MANKAKLVKSVTLKPCEIGPEPEHIALHFSNILVGSIYKQ